MSYATKPGLLYETKLATLIREKVAALESAGDLDRTAREIGFNSGRILQVMARGESRVSLVTVPRLARLLGLDTMELIRLASEQYREFEGGLNDPASEANVIVVADDRH
jgi:hypothetical protein